MIYALLTPPRRDYPLIAQATANALGINSFLTRTDLDAGLKAVKGQSAEADVWAFLISAAKSSSGDLVWEGNLPLKTVRGNEGIKALVLYDSTKAGVEYYEEATALGLESYNLENGSEALTAALSKFTGKGVQLLKVSSPSFGPILVLAGAARVGKSTIAKTFDGFRVISGDQLKDGVRAVMENVGPGDITLASPQWLDYTRKKDDALWEFHKAYLHSAQTRSRVLYEGQVWPEKLSQWDVNHYGVFLIDTNARSFDRLKKLRDSDPESWQHAWDDAKLKAWSKHNLLRSETLKSEAAKFDYPVVDLKGSTQAKISKAVSEALIPIEVEEKEEK